MQTFPGKRFLLECRPSVGHTRLWPEISCHNETALPADFGNATPEAQLAAFRDKIRSSSKITPNTFTDHHGHRIERMFDGDTVINGERIAYETWPLLENPWMRQEWNGDLILTDGKVKRHYDLTHWAITETNTQ